MRTIDGSQGEGGGQILRTSLALSLITGEPFRIEGIRAGRKRPGLLRQHLTSVRAAAEIGGAEVAGAELHSATLEFRPRAIRAGEYRFEIGSAGSVCLVLQAILPALLLAPGRSRVEIEGGTHVSFAPTWDYFARVLVPLLARMGAALDVTLLRPGFMPAGGGRVAVEVTPAPLRPLELLERGPLRACRATAWLAHIPRHVGERELDRVRRALDCAPDALVMKDAHDATCPGNALTIELESEHIVEMTSALGERGRSAETVARDAIRPARRYLKEAAPVGEHLADQLLLPLALTGGGSFRTRRPSLHTRTNIGVLETFLPTRITLHEDREHTVRVELSGPSLANGPGAGDALRC